MKDPAVLFYFQDFLVGTDFMSADEVGKYIRILCHQADKGSLTLSQLKRICEGSVPEAVMEKLKIDDEGKYYQERMRTEREKRMNYSESRRQNRVKKENNICKTYDSHMENENENINTLKNKGVKGGKEINISFDVFWDAYGKKVGNKKLCIQRWNKLKDEERQTIIDTLPSFLKSISDKKYLPYPEKYLNERRWEDEISIPPVKNNSPVTPAYIIPGWQSR